MEWNYVMAFSTYDSDNDSVANYSCAAVYIGGFWMKSCFGVAINLILSTDEQFSWDSSYNGNPVLHLSRDRMWLLVHETLII